MYSCASFCILGHLYPWVRALCDNDMPFVWLLHILSCISSKSGSTASEWTQSKYGPEKECLNNFCSSDNQKRGAFLCILSTSGFLLGKTPSLRNRTKRSIQLGPTMIWWTWTFSFFSSVGLCRSSTSITWGRSCLKKVARVAKESASVFLLLRIYCMVKNSKPDYKSWAWFKYPCILKSLASNSPFTCPTINHESENNSTIFPSIFWTIAIPISKVSYLASLFVAEKPNLKHFLIVILSGDTITSPTLNPLWFATPSTYNFQGEGSCREMARTCFPPELSSLTSTSMGDLVNSATKSARTCPLTKVRGMYFMSNAPKIVPYLEILPI